MFHVAIQKKKVKVVAKAIATTFYMSQIWLQPSSKIATRNYTVGAFAVELGAADVVMSMITGETWFKVPETVEIRFIGKPKFGIGGKDTILHVLGELKRNTVAFERAVEYTGPGLQYLSCDSRFAISNMATEFGGISGVCEADEITAAFIAK